MSRAVAKAESCVRLSRHIIAGQFDNPANPAAHFDIPPGDLADTDGRRRHLRAGSAPAHHQRVGRYLKDAARVRVVVWSPGLALLPQGPAGPTPPGHRRQLRAREPDRSCG
jgi:cysteine synthase